MSCIGKPERRVSQPPLILRVARHRGAPRNERFAKRLVARKVVGDGDGVHVQSRREGDADNEQPEVREPLVAARDAVHAAVEPVLEILADDVHVVARVIRRGEHRSDELRAAQPADVGPERWYAGHRVGLQDGILALHRAADGEIDQRIREIPGRDVRGQRAAEEAPGRGMILALEEGKDERVFVERTRDAGTAGVSEQLPDATLQVNRPRLDDRLERLANGRREKAHHQKDQRDSDCDVKDLRSKHRASPPRDGQAPRANIAGPVAKSSVGVAHTRRNAHRLRVAQLARSCSVSASPSAYERRAPASPGSLTEAAANALSGIRQCCQRE